MELGCGGMGSSRMMRRIRSGECKERMVWEAVGYCGKSRAANEGMIEGGGGAGSGRMMTSGSGLD
jgi:hypothetical protein